MWNQGNTVRGNEKFGITSALSLAGPKPIDVRKTKELKTCLEPYGVFSVDAELKHRLRVLEVLQRLMRHWIRIRSLAKNMSLDAADAVGGGIYTFGSYRLGVHHKSADIDALCVAPCHIHRSEFFHSFYDLLKKQPQVKDLRAIENAFVPLMKFNFDGIDIDLLFARLTLKEIPDGYDLRDSMILRNMEQACVRSLNGSRVTDEILRLVPNVQNFRLALIAVKLWAKRRGIYSNSLGYLGGVSWAMLVARTCQLYPNALPATLVHKFFLVFSQWKWPQPVLLKRPDSVDFGFPVWNPKVNVADRLHLMPVITPAYPQQNSTYNVTASTRTIIMEEIKLGLAVTDEIMLGNCSWGSLFKAPAFFSRYKHFIVLLAKAASANDQLQWRGLIESKIRHLIAKLERSPCITIAHVNPECYNSVPLYTNNGHPLALPPGSPVPANHGQEIMRHDNGELMSNFCSMWFIGLEFAETSLAIDLTNDISSFTKVVEYQAGVSKTLRVGMSIEARYVRRKQLREYLSPELLRSEQPFSATKRRQNSVSAPAPPKMVRAYGCESSGSTDEAVVPTASGSSPERGTSGSNNIARTAYEEWRHRFIYGNDAK